MGDRSENAEYIYGSVAREIDRRMRFLSTLLDRVKVVDPARITVKDQFGATVTIEDENGEQERISSLVLMKLM